MKDQADINYINKALNKVDKSEKDRKLLLIKIKILRFKNLLFKTSIINLKSKI